MSEDILYKTELPDGWALINFPETCDSISLNGIKIKQKDYQQKGKYPIVDQGQDLIGGYFDKEALIVKGEPPFIIFGDHTKVKKFVNFKFIAGADGVKALKPFEFLNPKLFFYYLHCIKLPDKGYARHYQFLGKAEFPIPPLPEQHRIVAKIEELFSSLDKGIESLKTAQEQLKIYRQAVLKWAFEGFVKNSTIGDEFDFIGGGTPSKEQPYYWNGSLCWCSVKDVKGYYLFNTIDKITEKGLYESSANLAQPDEVILITRISPGKTIISKITTAINQDLKVIKPKKEYNSKLIHYLFQSIEREIIKLSSGTTVLGINLTNLKSINVASISISEQHHIVSEIEKRLSVCDQIEESIGISLQQAEALRQSILKKAFEGKLVEQDPNDEPASVLLERIKAEREAVAPSGRKINKNNRLKKAQKSSGGAKG